MDNWPTTEDWKRAYQQSETKGKPAVLKRGDSTASHQTLNHRVKNDNEEPPSPGISHKATPPWRWPAHRHALGPSKPKPARYVGKEMGGLTSHWCRGARISTVLLLWSNQSLQVTSTRAGSPLALPQASSDKGDPPESQEGQVVLQVENGFLPRQRVHNFHVDVSTASAPNC